MRLYILFSILVLALTLAASSPVDPGRRLVNRPKVDVYGVRVRRHERDTGRYKKVPPTRFGQPPELTLRKGEYMCGNNVCKLKPGEKTCQDCQHPL